MATFGNACTDRANNVSADNQTDMDTTNPINQSGTITSVCVNLALAGGTGKVKVFRINGTNFDFVAESGSQALSAGVNTFSGLSIGVVFGDFIAFYGTNNGNGIEADYDVGSVRLHVGDVTTNTAIADWTSAGRTLSILATFTPSGLDDVYVDINKSDDTGAGTSVSVAKKTMKAGWDILNSTGTMHVASGDYSAQTTIAYNKPWKLSPEDPNATGAKNVKIPKST